MGNEPRGAKAAGVSRRTFIGGAVTLGATMAATALGGCAPQASAESKAQSSASAASSAPDVRTTDTAGDPSYLPLNTELPTPKMPAPDTTEYACDVLVVGGGLTGLNAAWAAAEAGKSVVLVDKGTPGYSGLSAWPSCTAYYDPDLDADLDTWDEYMRRSCDCFANLTWEDVWVQESKSATQRLIDWGWISSYDRAADTAYWVDGLCWHDDVRGYYREFADKDRRKVFGAVLEKSGVTVVDHVMIVDVVERDGACVGAVGLHFKSGTMLSFAAKAVVLATGNGVTKSSGYPLGADTFDGIWMGYQHGLPITGVEFEDFHMTTRFAAGNVQMDNSWPYLENIWLTGGTVDAEHMMKKPGVQERTSSFLEGFKRSDTTELEDIAGAACSSAVTKGNADDPRKGKWTSPIPKGNTYGAAPGMCVHTAAGIWCGVDNTDCSTGIPGLYAAGDGTNGCYVGGPNYGAQRGSTSSFMTVQGEHAGAAAAAYADTVADVALPADKVAEISDEVLAPLSRETGYDPTWVRDTLHGIMAPGWVTIAKNEASLQAAKTQIVQLRELTSGKMMAQNPHDLRLVQEVEHQLLACELKINAGLERKESRGYHYRTDYPFKDDANYLHYLVQTKGDDGEPVFGTVELPSRWVGDVSASYVERYPSLSTPEEVAKYGEKN